MEDIWKIRSLWEMQVYVNDINWKKVLMIYINNKYNKENMNRKLIKNICRNSTIYFLATDKYGHSHWLHENEIEKTVALWFISSFLLSDFE